MRDTKGSSPANPAALKVVLGLGGLFVLVLLGIRLTNFAEFVQAVWDRAPLVLVEPEILGDAALVLAIATAPLLFLLPRRWRAAAGAVLIVIALGALAIGGNRSARGGSGSADTPLADWLQSRGYARCPAKDRVRGGGRSTRGEYVAEGWAQRDACPNPLDAQLSPQ